MRAVLAGPGAIAWFGPPQGQALPAGNESALISTVRDEGGAVVSEHMVQLVTPEHIRVPLAKASSRGPNSQKQKKKKPPPPPVLATRD